jgi:uncharacterized protein
MARSKRRLSPALSAVLLLAALTVASYCATLYPGKLGVVNDYAGKLTKAQVRELSDLIRQYERQTSIEIAVVVIDGLQGMTAQQYAISLGSAWGVGKAGRNNGVVLLWAPNERKYALRFGDGLTPDMSDADASSITQEYLAPNFRAGLYYAGLKETLEAVMTHLGSATWDQRLERRAQAAEEQRRREAAQQEEERKQTADALRAVFATFLFLAAAVAIGIAIHKWRQRREERTELDAAPGEISGNLAKAEANAPRLREILDNFSKETPEQDLKAQRADLEGQPDRIVKLRLDLTLLDLTSLRSNDEMVRIRTAAEAEAGLLDRIQQQLDAIAEAKRASQAMMEKLSREQFEISDVRNSARRADIDRMLTESRYNYEQARQNSSMSLVDWLIINDMLSRSESGYRQAVQYSQEEPEATWTSSDSSSSDSSSSIFSSSSSDSGGGFGGGGGFSSGSGSGSDGSY